MVRPVELGADREGRVYIALHRGQQSHKYAPQRAQGEPPVLLFW